MPILTSGHCDIHANLAFEERLLDQQVAQDLLLLFYQCDNAIVIGKNQNPWRECDMAWARAEGVALARRISGGGTVYHDRGNLNYSLIMPRGQYDQAGIFSAVLKALSSLGVRASLGEAGSILVGERKISGTAFCFRRDRVLHHGTLLVSSDLDRLRRALRPAPWVAETRAIRSRPAPVANLCEIAPELTTESVKEALCRELAGRDAARMSDDAMDASVWQPLLEKQQSWEWIYGATPRFEAVFDISADNKLTLIIEDGHVQGVDRDWAGILNGCRFQAEDLVRRLRELKHALAESLALTLSRAGI